MNRIVVRVTPSNSLFYVSQLDGRWRNENDVLENWRTLSLNIIHEVCIFRILKREMRSLAMLRSSSMPRLSSASRVRSIEKNIIQPVSDLVPLGSANQLKWKKEAGRKVKEKKDLSSLHFSNDSLSALSREKVSWSKGNHNTSNQ